MEPGRDTWWHDEVNAPGIGLYCEPEKMDAEDPLFILYTSGSTGKPKGVLHTTAGYMLYTNISFRYIFDYHDEDIHFCTADIGWSRATATSCTARSRTARPASCSKASRAIPIRAGSGTSWTSTGSTFSIRRPRHPRPDERRREVGHEPRPVVPQGARSVGEPINPEAWMWYHKNVAARSYPSWTRGGRPRRAHSDHAAARRHHHQARSATRPFFAWFPGS